MKIDAAVSMPYIRQSHWLKSFVNKRPLNEDENETTDSTSETGTFACVDLYK